MKNVFFIERHSPHLCTVLEQHAPIAMRKNHKTALYLFLAFCLVFGQKPVFGQQVWPGDVNNNGLVNSVDLLWLGVAYDAEGPERPGATTDWQGQALGPLWPQSFPNGLNYAYADCDGDGDVDEEDIDEAILPNFRLTHGTLLPDGFANAMPGSNAPKLSLVPSTTLAAPGETVDIDVVLGSPEQPAGQFYGIAFTGAYTTDLVANNGDDFTFDDEDEGWINPGPDDNLESLFFRDAPGGEYEVGLVRTDHLPVGGHGVVGTFSIIIEDIIVGLTDTIILQIDSIRLIDENNTVYSAIPDTAYIVVSLAASTSPEAGLSSAIRVFPNPLQASEPSWVEMPLQAKPLDISDSMGRPVPVSFSPHAGGRWRIQWPAGIPSGWYALRCIGPDGVVIARSILLH
jgi:hypothetical protein